MFVTPRKRGREEARRIYPLIPAFAVMARSCCGRSRARIAATDGQAQQRRTSMRHGAITRRAPSEGTRARRLTEEKIFADAKTEPRIETESYRRFASFRVLFN